MFFPNTLDEKFHVLLPNFKFFLYNLKLIFLQQNKCDQKIPQSLNRNSIA